MGLLKKLVGKRTGDKIEGKDPKEKPHRSEAPKSGTVLRPPAKKTAMTKEKAELTALEMAEQRDWEVKSLPVRQPGDVILDTYEVEDVISGGMGHVYIANHSKWNVKLAIKSPNQLMLENKSHFARILREANSWTELGLHPNIAYCYYVRNIEEVPHIFVEYVDGGNLRQWIQEGKCIDYRVSMDLAIQFCHGMAHAHSKGMIHRDIKPENVLMTRDGILKITDFGLVRGAGSPAVTSVNEESKKQEPAGAGLTTVGAFMGTEGYMAPEQAERAHEVDERADIFSFGVCLYEMFCGNRPYEMTIGNRQKAPEPMEMSREPHFPKALSEILKQCVAWDPDDRIRSFADTRKLLCDAFGERFHEKSPYADMQMVGLEEDGLNNQGVSHLELGNKSAAIHCFEKALEKDPTHPAATYNLSLIEWREGTIDDAKVLRRLENCLRNPAHSEETIRTFMAAVHAERFDLDAARETLTKLPGAYEEMFPAQQEAPSCIACLKTLKGHTGTINAVALTPDSNLAVTGGNEFDLNLKVWDLKAGVCLKTFEGHKKPVNAVAITSNGGYFVSASQDTTLKIWKVKTGACLKTLKGHSKAVSSVVLTQDEKLVISGSWDNTVKKWNIKTGSCLDTIDGVPSAKINCDGRIIASDDGQKIEIWDIDGHKRLKSINSGGAALKSILLTAKGWHAVLGRRDHRLEIWDLSRRISLKTLKGHKNDIGPVTISADGCHVLSGSFDQTLKLWDATTGTCVRTLEGHSGRVASVAISRDGRYVVSGGGDNLLKFWQIDMKKRYRCPSGLCKARSFETLREDQRLRTEKIEEIENHIRKGRPATAYEKLSLLWKQTGHFEDEAVDALYAKLLEKGRKTKLLASFATKSMESHSAAINSVDVSPDGRYALSASSDKTLKIWDLKSGNCIRTFEGHQKPVLSAAITRDQECAVSASADGTLKVWQIKSGRCLKTLEGHQKGVNAVFLTPDGQCVISGGGDSHLKLWELSTGNCLRTFEGHTNGVKCVAVSPDGRYAVSGSGDDTLRLWKLDSGDCIKAEDTYWFSSVAITPDGRCAITGGGDFTVSIWELATCTCQKILEGHTWRISSVAVTADGRYAISGSGDETIRIWSIDSGDCLKTLEGHSDGVHAVSLTPDGMNIVSGGADHIIKVWHLVWGLEFPNGNKRR